MEKKLKKKKKKEESSRRDFYRILFHQDALVN